jgi:hypothetical protein
MGSSHGRAIEKPGGGIPVALNLCLAFFHGAVALFQFVILPLWLLPKDVRWAWTFALLAMLTNPFWSLIHEAIHDLFHPNRTVNALAARLLAVLFGAPFRILRLSHLLHHKLNRLPVEGTEYYDKTKSSKAGAAPGCTSNFARLVSVEVLSPLFFLLPRSWLTRFKERFLAPTSVSGILMQNWLGAEALREIRLDGLFILALFSFSFYCYGERWPLLLAILGARGFLISFLDNVYHYETPVGDVFYARNLRLSGALERLLLHFNLPAFTISTRPSMDCIARPSDHRPEHSRAVTSPPRCANCAGRSRCRICPAARRRKKSRRLSLAF